MNTLQLEYFIAVVDEGGLIRAAEKLHVSPPAVSQVIKKLEDELDVKVFDRTGQTLALTFAGKRFLEYARDVLTRRNNFIREVHDQDRNIHGELTLHLSEYKAMEFLPIIVPAFISQHPNAQLNVVDRHLTPDLRKKHLLKGTYDFILSPHTIRDPDIQYIPICQERLCAIIGKGSETATRLFPLGTPPAYIELPSLCRERYILPRRNYSSRDSAEQLFQQFNLDPDILMEVHSSAVAYEIAATGIACSILYRYIGRKSNRGPTAAYEIPIAHPMATRQVYLAYNKRNYLSSLHRAFIDSALQSLSAKPSEIPG